MPDPQSNPFAPQAHRTAMHALVGGVILMGLKFLVFYLTNSAAVLSDAYESILNVASAAMMLYVMWLANKPADRDHPYGHGKIEFMGVGIEGVMILAAGVAIVYEAVHRLIWVVKPNLEWQVWLVAVLGVLSGILAIYVFWAGKRFKSLILVADAKHLFTDVGSTIGVFLGLLLVRYTGWDRLDPVIALIVGALVLLTSWTLLWQSVNGLMDRTDEADEKVIVKILDDEVTQGHIRGYHKVRHRHSGTFHWIDLHIQMDPQMTVRDSHAIATAIERRIEAQLDQADATAHVEPLDAPMPPQHPWKAEGPQDSGEPHEDLELPKA